MDGGVWAVSRTTRVEAALCFVESQGCGGNTGSGRSAVGLARGHGQETQVHEEASAGSGARPQIDND